MLKALTARLSQGHQTIAPDSALPEGVRGCPELGPCREGCSDCLEVCPTEALEVADGELRLDLGRCLLCGACARACPEGAVTFTNRPAMAVRTREDLILTGRGPRLAEALDRESLRLFGRSLRLRQVSAGGCNGCEAEVNALGNVVFDLGRFGIGFVASPRHADGLLITGPVTEAMREPLLATYRAVPPPRLVIAVGACALSGGPFRGSLEVHDGCTDLVSVDLYVPGCPPHPLTILDGLLRLLGRLPTGRGTTP